MKKIELEWVIRILSLLLILCFFIPSFAVSCSYQTVNINGVQLAMGISNEYGRISSPQPVILLVLLIPAVIIILSFASKIEKTVLRISSICLFGFDVLTWIVISVAVAKYCAENYCELEYKAGFVLSILAIIAGIVLEALDLMGILDLKGSINQTTIQGSIPGGGISLDNNIVNSIPQQTLDNGGKEESKKGKSILEKIWIVAMGLCITLGVVIISVVVSIQSKTINLNDYLVVEYEGYNGYATAHYYFDEEKFIEDYGDKLKYKDEGTKSTITYFGSDLQKYILNSIDGRLDKTNGLQNGDEITFSWDVSSDINEVSNYRFKYKDCKYTVSELEDVVSFNPFDYINVEFEGTSPYGMVDILDVEGTDGLVNSEDFIASDYSDLREGDTITVYFDCDIESFIGRTGRAPQITEKEYVVTGLYSYAESFSQIPKDKIEEMIQQGKDVIISQAASDWKSEWTLDSINCVDSFFLKAKFNDLNTENALLLVMEVNASLNNEEKKLSDTIKFYEIVEYDNISIGDEGKCYVDLREASLASGKFSVEYQYGSWYYNTITYYFKGYTSIEDFVNSKLLTVVTDYTYEENPIQ